MSIDSIIVKLFSDNDNLNTQVVIKENIVRSNFVHTESLTALYVILSPWHNMGNFLNVLQARIKKSGLSYVEYKIDPDVLSPDYAATLEYFKKIDDIVVSEIKTLKKKFNFSKIKLIGISLSCVCATMIANHSSEVDELSLVVPGSSLAEPFWEGIRTRNLKRIIEKRGGSLAFLKKYWSELAPENNLSGLASTKIKVYLSESDVVIPYFFGKRLAEEMKKLNLNPEVSVNKFLGHYLTIAKFCLRFVPSS